MLGLTIGLLICLAVAGGLSCLNSQEGAQSQEDKEELTLNDYPDVFKEDTLIVIGDNASRITKESAEAIASQFENLTGNLSIIKNDTAIVEDDKTGHNLILVGTPNANCLLQEVYNLTNATRVTGEYPGAYKGILEILRNPWNEDKAMLLVVGSDENGMMAGINEIYWLHLSKWNVEKSQGDEFTVVGALKIPEKSAVSWSPSFGNSAAPSPFVETDSGEIYYLLNENVYPYLYLLPGEDFANKKVKVTKEVGSFNNRTVEVKGKIEKREIEVPLRRESNPPTKIETFNVIVVSDLKVLNGSIIEE